MRLVFGESYATFSERRVAGDDFYDETRGRDRIHAFVPETDPTEETVHALRRSIREQLDAWHAMERFSSNEPEETKETFVRRWIEERAELAAAEAFTCAHFPARGAHVMPVTTAGYASATAVADAIQRLTR